MINSAELPHLREDITFADSNPQLLGQMDILNYPPGVGGEFISILIAKYKNKMYYPFKYRREENINRYVVEWDNTQNLSEFLKAGGRCLLRTHDLEWDGKNNYYIYCDSKLDCRTYNLLINIKANMDTKQNIKMVQHHKSDGLKEFFKSKSNVIRMSKIFEPGYLGAFFDICSESFDAELLGWRDRNNIVLNKYKRLFY